MARDFVYHELNSDTPDEGKQTAITRKLVNRHIAWLHALTFELRKPKEWEHNSAIDNRVRKQLGAHYSESKFELMINYND